MTVVNAELYLALLAAQVPEEQAQAAARFLYEQERLLAETRRELAEAKRELERLKGGRAWRASSIFS